MTLIKEVQPQWILEGCASHGLALVLKHLGDPKKGKVKWIVKVYDVGLLMSNVVNGAAKVRFNSILNCLIYITKL
jgi:hypothetical protein